MKDMHILVKYKAYLKKQYFTCEKMKWDTFCFSVFFSEPTPDSQMPFIFLFEVKHKVWVFGFLYGPLGMIGGFTEIFILLTTHHVFLF